MRKNIVLLYRNSILLIKTIISIIRIIKNSCILKIPLINNNDEIIIIGNGPSFKNQFSQSRKFFFNGKKVFCVNNMVNGDFYELLKPKYYLICDQGYFVNDKSKTLNMMTEKFLNMIEIKTKWKMYLFIPHIYRSNNSFLQRISKNQNIEIVFFNSTNFNGFEFVRNKLWINNLSAPDLINVLIGAIFLSLNMGYKKIYLCGAEHSWFKNYTVGDDNLLYLVDEHCYDKEIPQSRVLYNDDQGKIPSKIYNEMYCFYRCFKEYHELNGYAKKINAEIINITPNSFIDAFKRMKI